MDRTSYARKRRQGPGQPTTKPPVRLSREKKDTQKTRATQGSGESTVPLQRDEGGQRPSRDSDPSAKSFTVGNVGRNGTLYLKPSTRVSNAHSSRMPATPPRTSGRSEGGKIERLGSPPAAKMASYGSPKVDNTAGTTFNTTVPVPPPSIGNAHNTGRGRSHSFSTIDDAVKAQPQDAAEFQLLLNGQEPGRRPKSSFSLSEGLANFRIPHYRLGTPRFSDRGTAYLHNSIRSSMTEDIRSSVFSKAEYDRFPAPPGASARYNSRRASGAMYLTPTYAGSSTTSYANRFRTNHSDRIDRAMYDHVEANINNPSLVRYSTVTGRIMAATPARLIAQITSPWFLDYELLSDFFLTYRNFLTSHDLLDYLLVRLDWALANGSDSGRIVTVRTFVALRHWILNYFADDFLPDFELRQKFCDRVNGVGVSLLQLPDRGGSDLNIIGELKKCWRRICAMFWYVEDVAETSPDLDIVPGEEDEQLSAVRASATSLIQSGQYDGSIMDFRRSSIVRLPPTVEDDGPRARMSTSAQRLSRTNTASIPATPASENSMTVLSCSVPFLRHMKTVKEASPDPGRDRPLSQRSTATARRHNRSASFSDALRDERTPLSGGRANSVDLQSLPLTSFTGGLVRGLLLQPSPSKVELLIPTSPPLDTQAFDFGQPEPSPSLRERDRQWQNTNINVGVKKVVGDVRRVLSHRNRDSPASSNRSTNSSGSHSSGHSARVEHTGSWQQLQGPPRVDVLGEKVESTYRDAVDEAMEAEAAAPPLTEDQRREPGMRLDLLHNPNDNRLHSHVTTGSRSIVIVDDTGIPNLSGAASPPLPSRAMASQPLSIGSSSLRERSMHDLLSVPGSPGTDATSAYESAQARKSSSAHPAVFDIPPIRHQLRRRPGGDLKGADNVQDLERSPRPDTEDSYSTFSQAILSSGQPSADLSHVHVVEHDDPDLPTPPSFLQARKKESWTLLSTHSSQPNMRASMKAKVSQLARLPDDPTEGGIEDALAKLEGKNPSPTASVRTASEQRSKPTLPLSRLRGSRDAASAQPSPLLDGMRSPATDRQGASIYHLSDAPSTDTNTNVRRPERDMPIVAKHQSQGDPVELSESAVALLKGEAKKGSPTSPDPKSDDSQTSFLLDDNQSLSDISTEMADDQSPGGDDLGVRSFYFDDAVEDDLRHVPFRPPPTPPSTEGGAPNTQSEPRSPTSLFQKSVKEASSVPKLSSNAGHSRTQSNNVDPTRGYTRPSQKHTAHLPFVLAFESDIIAEQLTIIEKDALDEVDWKDLIGLNWQHSPLHLRNWVDFLQRTDCNGIDIVVSRFNLMVKWVVSECVLTEAASERARCITKYIHIAAHAHRLRNYATMYQITLALLSTDLARLHKTWALVAPAEKAALARLEKLCQPRGNFHQLRMEMEAASADEACIPFIGLYTHDLMFNAQKPSRVNPPATSAARGGGSTEPLVNFERFQTAAGIVKGLLTLIEASAKYVLRPHPEVLSRCLWLAALEDGEIVSRSRGLEA